MLLVTFNSPVYCSDEIQKRHILYAVSGSACRVNIQKLCKHFAPYLGQFVAGLNSRNGTLVSD